MANHQGLLSYLTNLCGTKIHFYGGSKNIVEAIKGFNQDIEFLKAEVFGYSSDFKSYISKDLVITADGITQKETPIKYEEVWQKNKLGFEECSEDELGGIKNQIIAQLLPWDDLQRTSSSLAFTFLPLIFPLMEGIIDGNSI